MSSRASIVYTKHFHIYMETLDRKICVQLSPSKLNDKYEDPEIEESELRQIYEELKEYFKELDD